MVRKILMTLVLAAVVAPSATARPGPPPALVWAPGVEISYTETVRDGLGNIVSRLHRDGIPTGRPFGTAVTTGPRTADDPPLQRSLTRKRACCSSWGSDTVEITVTKRTLLGFVAWRYHQVDHWCWSYPRITCLSIGAGFYDVDSQQSINYDSSGYGWYYRWSGSDVGGHYAYRQGSISNCVLKYGCLSTSYPWVEIWLNGNGAWTGNAGGA